nr:MAG TPA: NinB protein [Caudoviricetes sp.]
MLTTQVKWLSDRDGAWLCCKAPLREVMHAAESFREGKTYEVQLKEHRKRRSTDANAYLWTLLGRISAKVGAPPETIYRSLIRDIGGNYTVLPIRDDAIEEWCQKIWAGKGIGWVADVLGPSKLPGYTNVICYYGSHVYDTATMGRLIDTVIAECKELGIEHLPPEELERMMTAWDRKNTPPSPEA